MNNGNESEVVPSMVEGTGELASVRILRRGDFSILEKRKEAKSRKKQSQAFPVRSLRDESCLSLRKTPSMWET